MTRREFIGVVAAGVLAEACRHSGLVLPPAIASREYYAFTLGDRRLVALLDGTGTYKAASYFSNATPESSAEALARHGITDPAKIPSSFVCLAISDASSGWILVDTGLGNLSPTAGRLQTNLAAAGIRPADVHTVVLSHGHPDHIAGNVRPDGALAFPNARFVMWEDEWRFWTSDDTLAKVPALFAEVARRQLPPIRDRLTLLTRETEVARNLVVLPALGHTPGHCAVAIGAGSDQLLFTADAALHPIHLEHPDWYPTFDMDPVRAVESKRRLFDRAAADRALVLAFHFPTFPSLGRVAQTGAGGWRWTADPAV
jgi:glyoxylase-like metal-dependent hydrolase (beta-lactamase superfamily II)